MTVYSSLFRQSYVGFQVVNAKSGGWGSPPSPPTEFNIYVRDLVNMQAFRDELYALLSGAGVGAEQCSIEYREAKQSSSGFGNVFTALPFFVVTTSADCGYPVEKAIRTLNGDLYVAPWKPRRKAPRWGFGFWG